MWRFCAPVKAPASWPNSSLSSSSDGIAAVFSATNGLRERGDSWCSACATSSLPVPVSPVISTDSGACARRPIARNSARIAGVSPISWGVGAASLSWAASAASSASGKVRAASATASSRSNGLDRNSCAPPRNAPAVLATSVYADITITGSCGCVAFSVSSSTRPSSPGMRTSVNSRSGAPRAPRACRAAAALSKPSTVYPASRSAVASTKRTERSSSTTQMRRASADVAVARRSMDMTFLIGVVRRLRQQQGEDRVAGARAVGQ